MTRDNVYKEIDRERAYQATLDHTRTDGCAKSVGDYINLLGYYADRARAKWTEHAGTFSAREMIRKLAACAVACLENHECPPRISLITGQPFQLQPGELASRRSDAEYTGKVSDIRARARKQLVALKAEFDTPSGVIYRGKPIESYSHAELVEIAIEMAKRPHMLSPSEQVDKLEKSKETGLEPNFNVGIDAPVDNSFQVMPKEFTHAQGSKRHVQDTPSPRR